MVLQNNKYESILSADMYICGYTSPHELSSKNVDLTIVYCENI